MITASVDEHGAESKLSGGCVTCRATRARRRFYKHTKIEGKRVHRRRTKEGPGPVISTSANYRVCTRVRLHQRQPCVWCEGAESAHAVIWCVWYVMHYEFGIYVAVPSRWVIFEWRARGPNPQRCPRWSASVSPHLQHVSVCDVLCSHHYLINKLCATDFWNAHHARSHSPMCHHTRTAHDVQFGSAFMLWANGLMALWLNTLKSIKCWKCWKFCSSDLQGRIFCKFGILIYEQF